MAWWAGVTTAWGAAPAPFIDAHSHYTAADTRNLDPAGVIAKLDEAGISRMVVSGTPAALAHQLHEHAPERIIPLLGVYGDDADKATWMRDRGLPERVAAQLKTGRWAGIGELHLFAEDARNEVFEALVRMAAQKGLMLLIHGDPEVVDHAFRIAPDVRVLWAHLGTEPTPQAVRQMLDRHRQRALWIDTSVRDDRIAPEGRLLPAWRDLFESHPERFVVAIDAFSPGRWSRYAQVANQIRRWTDALHPSTRDRLLRLNAEALFEPWLRPPTGAVRPDRTDPRS